MTERRARMQRAATWRGVEYEAGDLAPREAVRGVELLHAIFARDTDVAPCVTLDLNTQPPQKAEP